MVMDSLRYWTEEFHVDGFRFDLCATLGREPNGFDPGCGFFDALMQDPVLAQVKLISEPWDIGPGGYQVGNNPPGFAEWNDQYRDNVRSFWKGEAGLRQVMAARLLGSPDLFKNHRRRPWASVNFLTAHDGFTLEDLVTYNGKHNDANHEDNRDGSNDNRSFNWGEEGPTQDTGVRDTRERIKRSMMMTLMFSNGTPLLLGGDEFGRTQGGNNNAYCQDTPISWFDWALADSPSGRAFTEFTRICIATRQARPTLRSPHFYTEDDRLVPAMADVSWFDESGTEMTPEKWEFEGGRLLGLRRVAAFAAGSAGAKLDPPCAAVSLLLLNASPEDREFQLPEPAMQWTLLLDAAFPPEHGGSGNLPYDNKITVLAHSAMLLSAEHPLT